VNAEPFARPAFLPPLADLGPLRGRQVAMTGQRGVLGSLLAERLAAGGAEVAGYAGDVNDVAALGDWLAGLRCSHFFHFAALVPVDLVEADPLQAYQTNVIGTFNACRALLRSRHDCWFFQCSSSHVYRATRGGEPLAENAPTEPGTYYGVTKLAAERVVAELLGKLGRPWCTGRVFSYTHARQRPPYLVPSLRERILATADGGTLAVQNPSSVRDIQDASHVIEAMLWLARLGATGLVNIGSGQGHSVRELALAVARQCGRRIEVSGEDRDPPAALVADTTRLRALLEGAGAGA
jgi:nucleoside-diphosphate-sugar epimerase